MPASSRIYLDYNATAPLRACAREAIQSAMARAIGNPASPHAEGRAAFALLDRARQQVAMLVGSAPSEVVFTSGGTEAVNAMIWGLLRPGLRIGGDLRIAVTATDHACVLEMSAGLAGLGVQVHTLRVDGAGRVDLAGLADALGRELACVVTHWANNETGVVQDLDHIASLCSAAGTPLLIDGVQAAGKVPVDFASTPAAALAISAHKLGGPAGIGALLLRENPAWTPLLRGGHQERDRRAGTEAVLAAVGFGAAASAAAGEAEYYEARVGLLRDRLVHGLRAAVPTLVEHGAQAPRVANTANVRFPGWPAQRLLQRLDLEGIAVGTGAACASGVAEPSHVLLAMGMTESAANEAIRFSLGYDTTVRDVDQVIGIVRRIGAEWGVG